jgi:hypothetical protein
MMPRKRAGAAALRQAALAENKYNPPLFLKKLLAAEAWPLLAKNMS